MSMGGFYTPEVEFQKYVEHLGVELARLEAENERLQAKVESASTNTASAEICSNDVCDYCTHGVGHCTEPCRGCSSFTGRKLRT